MSNIVALKPVVQPYLSNEVVQNLDLYDLLANAGGSLEVSLTVKAETVNIKGAKYLQVTETRMARTKLEEKPKRSWPFRR